MPASQGIRVFRRRKELIAVLTFSLGEVPAPADLRREGIDLQQYGEALVGELQLPGLDDYEVNMQFKSREVVRAGMTQKIANKFLRIIDEVHDPDTVVRICDDVIKEFRDA